MTMSSPLRGDFLFDLLFRRPTGENPTSLAFRDLDFDGFPELVVGNRDGDSISVLRNRRGSFDPSREFPTGRSPLIVSESIGSDLNVLTRGAPDVPTNRVDSLKLRDLRFQGPDCDGDGVLNECEILHGSPDANADGIPDECQGGRHMCPPAENCVPDELYLCFPGEGLGPTLEVGEEFEMRVMIDAVSEGIQGWSFGVEHDSAWLEILEVTTEGLTLPPNFRETTAVGEPSPGLVSSIVLAIFPPPGVALLPSSAQALVRARYRVLRQITAADTTLITFTDKLVPNPGSPPTSTNLTIDQSTRRPIRVFDAELGVMRFPFCSNVPVTRFARGDVNADGLLDMSDAIAILRRLFLGEQPSFDCDDALDVNDDGRLEITDPVVLVFWMFAGSSRPSFPFLDCGIDPTEDDLTGAISNCVTGRGG